MLEEARARFDPVCPRCGYLVARLGATFKGEVVLVECQGCGWSGTHRASMPAVPERPAIHDAKVAAQTVRKTLRGDEEAPTHRLIVPAGETVTIHWQHPNFEPTITQVLTGPPTTPTPRLFTYDEVLAAMCPYCRAKVPGSFETWNDGFFHLDTAHSVAEPAKAFSFRRECVANDWRRSHPR
ncbi:MAG: hypothetical protein WC876_11690 [Candidatus Thermoplasmatota archaeon]|jgi:hypothetical protein